MRTTCCVMGGPRVAGVMQRCRCGRLLPGGRNRGAALIAVLWIGMLAAVILAGVRQAVSVNLALGQSDLEAVQARWLARAGLEQALAVLAEDDPYSDSPWDLWYDDEYTFGQIELSTGFFSVVAPPDEGQDPTIPRYGLVDLTGLLNINDADEDQLNALMDQMGLEPVAVPAILDWRDSDSNARAGGAEAAHYNSLDLPYDIRDGRFQTVDELRLVDGIDQETFFGEDTNRSRMLEPFEDDGPENPPDDDADGQLRLGLVGLTTVYSYELNRDGMGGQRVNINRASEGTLRSRFQFTPGLARAVVQRRNSRQFQSLLDLLEVPEDRSRQGGLSAGGQQEQQVTRIDLDWLGEHLDELTLSGEDRLPARINLNTAPRQVLMTLPGMTEQAAQSIIEFRSSPSGPFENVGQLRTQAGIDDALFRQIAERVAVRSSVFEVTSIGWTQRGVRRRLVAVVDRQASPVRVLYWYESG